MSKVSTMGQDPTHEQPDELDPLRERITALEAEHAQLREAHQDLHREMQERSRAQRAARESEHRFRAVAQTAVDAIITIDAAGDVVFWNPAAEKMFGYSAAEMMGSPLTPIMPERYRMQHVRALDAAVSTGRMHMQGRQVRLEALRRDGGEFPVELSLSTWKTGEEAFFTGIVRDISERARIEEEGRRLMGQLRHLAEAAKRLHVKLEPAAVLRELVAGGMRLTDAEGGAAGVMGDHRMALTERHRAGRIEPVDQMFEWGEGVPGWVLQTGRPYLCNDAATDVQVLRERRIAMDLRNLINIPILGSDGSVLGCFEVHNKTGGGDFNEQDIEILETLADVATHAMENALALAERRRAAESLRESEQRFRAMAEAAFEGIIIHEKGLVLEANEAFCRMVGYEVAELIDREVIDLLVAPESRDTIRKQIAAGGEKPYLAVLQRRDGSTFPAEIRGTRVQYHGLTARVAVLRERGEGSDRPAGDAL